jgi:hypothetical protein
MNQTQVTISNPLCLHSGRSCNSARSTGRIEVTVEGSKRITFILEGRSTAEGRFKREAEAIRQASAAELVSLEWVYLPFYFIFGHSVLRIGNHLYEFGKQGWRIHPSARAFLFNNPFFKRRFARYREWGMCPFSFGVPLFISKSLVEKIVETITEQMRSPSQSQPFSLLLNNCNHRLLDTFRKAGLTVEFTGFPASSSLRSFHRFLFDSPIRTETPYLYPLPNHKWMTGMYHMHIPEHIYHKDSVAQRAKRILLWLRVRSFLRHLFQ